MKKPIIFMDTETTGLEHDRDQILSITMAAVNPVTGTVIEKRSLKIAARGDVVASPEAVAVNRINPITHKGQSEARAAQAIQDFFVRHGGKQASVGGYNVSFDVRFVRSLLSRSGLDSSCVGHSRVDLYDEAIERVYKKQFPVDDLKKRSARDLKTGKKVERISLNQGSVARALKIDVDPSRLHDDSYDVDTSIEIWRRLGRPSTKPAKLKQGPYAIQSELKGKIVQVDEWDYRTAEAVKRKYYITGYGAGESDDRYGKKTYHKTVVIPLDGAAFSDAAQRLDNERKAALDGKALKQGGLRETALSKISKEWGYDKNNILQISPVDGTEEELQLAKALAEKSTAYVNSSRLKRLNEKHALDEASCKINFKLKNPNDKTSIISGTDELLVPDLARQMSSMSEAERVAFITEVADDKGRGNVWANNMHKMACRYGYRNGLDGFEKERLERLSELMPEAAKPKELKKELEDLKSGREAMNKAGYKSVLFSSDGKGIDVMFFPTDGRDAQQLRFDNFVDDSGRTVKPRASTVAEGIGSLLACSHKEANDIRTGFNGFVDAKSYDVIKQNFKKKIHELEQRGDFEAAEALKGTLDSLGPSYEIFLKNSRPRPSESGEALTDGQAESLDRFMRNAELVSLELSKDYQAIRGYDLDKLGEASMETVLAANLTNPAVKKAKELDSLCAEHNIDLAAGSEFASGGGPTQSHATNEQTEVLKSITGELGQKLNFDVSRSLAHKAVNIGTGSVRCKVCGREVQDKNAIGGMGPVCGRRLLDFIGGKSAGDESTHHLEFQHVSDFSKTGQVPIIAVRDKTTGKTFVADVVRREPDGRFLVVDLSDIAHRTEAGSFDPIRDAARVYLDEQNHEIARILARKKTPKK